MKLLSKIFNEKFLGIIISCFTFFGVFSFVEIVFYHQAPYFKLPTLFFFGILIVYCPITLLINNLDIKTNDGEYNALDKEY